MKLTELFENQATFEKNIIENTSIKENVVGDNNVQEILFLALQVKVGELANLTKCYKYYYVKPNLSKHKLIIRYTDALRYLLSIGNRHQFNIIETSDLNNQIESEEIIQIFSTMYDDISLLKKSIKDDLYLEGLNLYRKIISTYIHLGKLLGLSQQDIKEHFDSQL